ncbi:MAG TPA: VIT domain-containing protein, partial [Gemmatimonadaceae bacterium]
PPAGGAPARDSTSATIVGRVTSEVGAPLQHASVFVEGTGIGALAGADGRYTLSIPEAKLGSAPVTMVARLIGYRQTKREVRPRAGRTDTVNFVLESNPLRLSEQVVVTALGSAAQTSTFAAPVSDAAAAPPPPAMETGFAKALERADEVVVVSNSGTPGANGAVWARVDSASAAAAVPAGAGGAVNAMRQRVARVTVRGATATMRNTIATSAPATPEVPPATQGVLRARGADGQLVGEFPLRHTDVRAEISGFLARTVVEQRYVNPFRSAIEAVYVFPLPSLAAVNDFVMEANGRTIVGVVRPRAEAERIYREALARGQTASLLTQERPNIFTQSVANIAPGGEVSIRITYFERLAYEHGEYAWVFPMVVGPRYIPGSAHGPALLASRGSTPSGERERGGTAPNTDVVPDASRITPPVLRPGERSGHDISLSVTLDAGLPVTRLTSVAHQVEIERPSTTRRIVRLSSRDAIPNRDFVLRWSVAGEETQVGVLTHRDRTGGYVTLAVQPPAAPRDAQVIPREITFIMDVSGSMMGMPIAMSKELVTRTLDELRPDDRFNIVYFAGGNAQLWERAHRRSPENVVAAKRFLQNLSAGGGTEMLAGLERALHAEHDARHLQMYVFLTDGFVGDEPRILRTIATERGDARFFGFGIGSSVNRYLIDGIGAEGGGQSFVVIPRDPAHTDRAVAMLFDAIDSPVLADVAIDWNGLPVADAYPSKLRDLFAGQTIDVIARYTKPASGTAWVTGRIGRRRVRYPVRVVLPARDSAHAALAPAWARWRIADLSSAMLAAGEERRHELEREITDLAVEYHLVSQYTAFVAVDRSRVVGDGHPLTIMQPVELPEGVSYQGIFGEQPVGLPMRIGAWGLDVQGTAPGHVRVARVEPGSPAGRAGLRPGAELRAVNGTPVHDVGELERVLLQAAGEVRLETGGGAVEMRAP